MKTLDRILWGVITMGPFVLGGACGYACLKRIEYEGKLVEVRQIYKLEIEEIRREDERAIELLKQKKNRSLSDIVAKYDSVNRDFYCAVIKIESNENPNSVSKKGARGLMQIMPETWKDMTNLPFDAAFDPETNVGVGVKYLHWIANYLSERIPGWENMPEQKRLEMIAAAYNGGAGRLVRANGDTERMPKETKEYVPKVMRELERMRRR